MSDDKKPTKEAVAKATNAVASAPVSADAIKAGVARELNALTAAITEAIGGATRIAGDPKKKDEKVKTRVFKYLRPPAKEYLHTLMRLKTMIGGTILPELSISIGPNHAGQYVLGEGAQEYQGQLAALRNYEALEIIKEVPLDQLGVPWIPPIDAAIEQAKKTLVALTAAKDRGDLEVPVEKKEEKKEDE